MEERIFSETDIMSFIKDLPLLIWEKQCVSFFKSVLVEFNLENATIDEKITMYLEVWKNTVVSLSFEYLPSEILKINSNVECTPFTFFLSSNTDVDFIATLDLSINDVEVLENLFKDKLSIYPSLPLKKDKANLMLGMILLPPISRLFSIYKKAYQEHSRYLTKISEIVGCQGLELPTFETNIGLYFGRYFMSHRTYKNCGGMDGLIYDNKLQAIRDELINIKKLCPDTATIDKKVICPHCGVVHDISAQQTDIFFAHLLDTKDAIIFIGFVYYEDYVNDIHEFYKDIIVSLPDNINIVNNAKCVIIVEGDTEEYAIPSMAIKMNKPLSIRKIHVWNAKSKQKVLMDFIKVRDNFPEMKICTLLDSDAIKEKEELERFVKGNRDKYTLKYINLGTFEDLIPIGISIDALNSLYTLERPMQPADFDTSKPIVKQFEKILYDLGKAKFDKVLFINEVLKLLQPQDIPAIIKEIVDDAYNFTDL